MKIHPLQHLIGLVKTRRPAPDGHRSIQAPTLIFNLSTDQSGSIGSKVDSLGLDTEGLRLLVPASLNGCVTAASAASMGLHASLGIAMVEVSDLHSGSLGQGPDVNEGSPIDSGSPSDRGADELPEASNDQAVAHVVVGRRDAASAWRLLNRILRRDGSLDCIRPDFNDAATFAGYLQCSYRDGEIGVLALAGLGMTARQLDRCMRIAWLGDSIYKSKRSFL